MAGIRHIRGVVKNPDHPHGVAKVNQPVVDILFHLLDSQQKVLKLEIIKELINIL